MTAVLILFTIVFIVIYIGCTVTIKECTVATIVISSLMMYLSFGFWGYDHVISDDYQVPTDDIYSLSITTEVSGNFVLGCGSIDSTAYYTFYTKNSDGLYRMSKTSVGNTLIKLDSTQSPKLVKVVYRYTATPCTVFGGNETVEERDTGKRILVVPANTIRQEYKVN
jgi:hypothetical protein